MKKQLILTKLVCCLFVLIQHNTWAQTSPQSMQATYHVTSSYVQEIPALSDMDNIISAVGLAQVAPPKRQDKNEFVPDKGFPKSKDQLALRQQQYNESKSRKREATKSKASEVANFDAHLGDELTDPTGAIGPNHYVYAFNAGFGILDRSGNVLLEEASLATLFPGEELGDPIVLYDQFADRFIIMEFSSTPNGILIAVGQGPDPVNDGWHTYRFNTGRFPDYEKMSIWHDGYYITTNKIDANPRKKEVVYALNRDQMLAGEEATMIGFPLPGITKEGFYSPGGLNALGSVLPPSDVKHQFMYMQDDSWRGVKNDHIKVWETTVDWDEPSNSKIELVQKIRTTEFEGVFDGGSFQNLPEPGGGRLIDALQATMMYMTNYRRFEDHNSVVLNFVVNTDLENVMSGIRWYELRQSADGEPWEIYQEGTFIDPDGYFAFCGSISMDKKGNIGLGYTVTSVAKHLSIRYTGRLAGDELNLMTLPATTAIDGDARSNRGDGRYGDYAQLTIDPKDDMTFWHIGEYMKGANPELVRRSRVVAFRLGEDVLDNKRPSVPKKLVASNVSQTSVDLKWRESKDNVDVTSYEIFNFREAIGSAGGTASAYTLDGLLPSTTYKLSLRAKDAAGNLSKKSTPVEITTLDGEGCFDAIASFPYTQGFEDGLGTWKQSSEDDVDWETNQGQTPNSGTGPDESSEGSSYLYVNSSGDAIPNKSAIISTPCFDLSKISEASISFDYHMYGNEVGSLALEVSDDNSETWTEIWSESGNKGNQWITINKDLEDYVGSTVQLRFNRLTSDSDMADVAIDNIIVKSEAVPDAHTEGFEDGLGDWTQSTEDDIDWERIRGEANGGTGRVTASEGVTYLYVDESQDNALPNKSAIITSPNFDLSGVPEATFSFDYFMYGYDVGSLALEVSDNDGDTWTEIWIENGHKGIEWQTQDQDLSDYIGSTIKLRFDRTTLDSDFAEVAIDNIRLNLGGYGDSDGGDDDCFVSGDLTLRLVLDEYPEETSWELTNSLGVLIASERYINSTPIGTEFTETIEGLNPSDYVFTILDSGNDGICCGALGDGSYQLEDSEGSVIAFGDVFDDYESTEFCLSNRSGRSGDQKITTQILDQSNRFALSPNPTGHFLEIMTKGEDVSKIELFSMFGKTVEMGHEVGQVKNTDVQSVFDVSGLPSGTYFIRITSNGETVTKRFIKK